MRVVVIRLLLSVLLFVSFAVAGGRFMAARMLPEMEHLSAMRCTERTFIRTELGEPFGEDALFVARSQVRIHRTLHADEDAVFGCEQGGNTRCYVSAVAVDSSGGNGFLERCLLKGALPADAKSAVINRRLAKALGCGIGDTVCIKTAALFGYVQVCGIVRNFYGFPDFTEDSRYYCILNRGGEYKQVTPGGYFSFSGSAEGAFVAERVQDHAAPLERRVLLRGLLLFASLFFLDAVIVCFVRRALWLPAHYRHLLLLGKSRAAVRGQMAAHGAVLFAAGLVLLCPAGMLAGGGAAYLALSGAALALADALVVFMAGRKL